MDALEIGYDTSFSDPVNAEPRMAIEELVAVLPCHSFDDFPFYLEGADADGVLAAYTSLWHPALIATAGKTPTWRRGDDDELPWKNCLVTLPKTCQDDMPGYWLDEARAQDAVVVDGETNTDRSQMIDAALAALPADVVPTIQQSLVDDFLALGLCHLLSEILTVQMRYSSLLDEERFRNLVVEAAEAALTNNEDSAQENLQACFDCLAESRDHYYAVDAFLIELVLTTPSLLGGELLADLQQSRATNLLISGEDLALMQRDFPDSLAALRLAVDEQRVCVIGGEPNEQLPLPLRSMDVVVDHFRKGRELYEQHLGRAPTIFARRQRGLSATLPQVLVKSGFIGAVHFTLDDGRFPDQGQSRVQWEGVDGSTLEALARFPLDANLPETILKFPQQMSESMDIDHVATVCFARWPGQGTTWFRDLQRIAVRTSALGKFVTLEKYFEETELPNDSLQSSPDEYRAGYLRQAVEQNLECPVSENSQQTIRIQQQHALATVDAMTALIGSLTSQSPEEDTQPRPGQDSIEGDDKSASPSSGADDDTRVQATLRQFAAALPRQNRVPAPGYLAVNPCSFARQVAIDTPDLNHPPQIEGAIKCAHEFEERRQVIVDIPPFGYVWIAGDKSKPWSAPTTKPLAEPHLLRNEHFEVHIDPESGGVRSIYNFRQRGNLLSQQLAMRLPSDHAGNPYRRKPTYSKMIAESIKIAEHGPATAAITSRGRLLHDEQHLADYCQTIRVMRSSPVLHFQFELQPHILPEGAPWDAYYASRFAWPDEGAEIFRDVAWGTHPTRLRRIEAPHFVEARNGSLRIAFLTTGLCYHEIVGGRQLDSLLIVPGESARRFDLSVAINSGRPQLAALDAMSPDLLLAETKPPPAPQEAWLIHVDTTQAIVSQCEVVRQDGRVAGVRLRLLEIAGRNVRAGLHLFRPVTAARKLDFAGRPLEDLRPTGDQVVVDLVGHECCDVELVWQNDSDN